MAIDKKIFSIRTFSYLFLAYLSLVFFLLLRGDENVKSIANIKPCSIWYWLLYIFFIPSIFCIVFFFGKGVIEKYNYRKSINFPYSEFDPKWDFKTILLYSIFGIITGIFSAAFGFGGGTLIGPLLFHMNIHPLIMKTTCNFIVLFNASSLTLQFMLAGMVNYPYALMSSIVMVISSIVASYLISSLIKKFKRPSIIVICVGIVFGLSCITVLFDLKNKIKEVQSSGKSVWAFNPLCTK